MMPPPHYVFGCGHEIELPPAKPEPEQEVTRVVIGCGHEIVFVPANSTLPAFIIAAETTLIGV